jgi:hypothetical protein
MFDTPKALFFDRRNQLAVAQDRGSDVAVVRIDAEYQHA